MATNSSFAVIETDLFNVYNYLRGDEAVFYVEDISEHEKSNGLMVKIIARVQDLAKECQLR